MLVLEDGDLFEIPDLDGIAHGVNAEGKMCSGIAVQFRDRFPDMHDGYLRMCKRFDMAGGMYAYYEQEQEEDLWIYNCFSQELAGPNASLEYLRSSLITMVAHAEYTELKRVGLPWIGTGVGALDREDVLKVFEEVLAPSTVEFIVVNYVPAVPRVVVALDVVENVLQEHTLEWRVNGYSSEFNKDADLSKVQGWCSCLERVDDYVGHIREEILKVVSAK